MEIVLPDARTESNKQDKFKLAGVGAEIAGKIDVQVMIREVNKNITIERILIDLQVEVIYESEILRGRRSNTTSSEDVVECVQETSSRVFYYLFPVSLKY